MLYVTAIKLMNGSSDIRYKRLLWGGFSGFFKAKSAPTKRINVGFILVLIKVFVSSKATGMVVF
jgi:hypothetical protein